MNISQSINRNRARRLASLRHQIITDALACMCLFGTFWLVLILAPLVAL